MEDKKLRRMVLTALFAALSAVATLAVRIPTVAGYTNFGDGVVLLGAYLLGPLYGGIAGGVGCALADLLAGYAYYVPGTLLVKGGSAVVAALLLHVFCKGKKPHAGYLVAAGVPAELFMAAGYFAYKALILGKLEGAIASIPGNLMQGVVGIAVSTALFLALSRVPDLEKYFWKGR